METENSRFMEEALKLARENMNGRKGGPFGCVIVKDGEIIAKGYNEVLTHNDPTCHAEIVAIRKACETLGTYQLTGCEIYSSCEPCPMCMGAIYWARLDKLYYAATRDDAANAGFDDLFIYSEIEKPFKLRRIKGIQMKREKAVDIFRKWIELDLGITY